MIAMVPLAALLLSLAPPSTRFVQADVLRVRSKPSPSAAVVARLGINTPLDLIERKGDWARLKTRSNPPLTGWALASLLSDKPLDPSEVRSQLASVAGAARLGLLERLAALSPTSRALQEELSAEYLKAGKTDAAKRIDERLAGNVPTYVGACLRVGTSRFVVAVVSFAENTGWTPLLGGSGERLTQSLHVIASELGGLPFVKLKGSRSVALPHSPFPAPDVGMHPGLEGDLSLPVIRLGTCTAKDEGWLYVTGPIAALAPDEPRLLDTMRALAEERVVTEPLVMVRQVFGSHTLALGIYAAREGRERGVLLVTLPPAPLPPARTGVVSWASVGKSPTVYLAAGSAWDATLLAKYSPGSGLETMIPTFPGRSGTACERDKLDTSGFSEGELGDFVHFEARSKELELLRTSADLVWFYVGEERPWRIASVNLLRKEVSCSDFPNLSRQLTVGGWHLPGARGPAVYASASLRSVRRPQLTGSALEATLTSAASTLKAPETWLTTRDGAAIFGLLPFDEVVCEATADDSICGGDIGYYVFLIEKGGRTESVKVVTSTTGC